MSLTSSVSSGYHIRTVVNVLMLLSFLGGIIFCPLLGVGVILLIVGFCIPAGAAKKWECRCGAFISVK